jgi:hypothetical protein
MTMGEVGSAMTACVGCGEVMVMTEWGGKWRKDGGKLN